MKQSTVYSRANKNDRRFLRLIAMLRKKKILSKQEAEAVLGFKFKSKSLYLDD